jgi:hypothetical protein
MNDKWKIIFGFGLLLIIAGLAGVIALGKVEKDSSYGLEIVLGCLTTLTGGFAVWAFSKKEEK